jgi:hypothetical protein
LKFWHYGILLNIAGGAFALLAAADIFPPFRNAFIFGVYTFTMMGGLGLTRAALDGEIKD